MKTLKIAFTGTGHISRVHARAARGLADLEAVAMRKKATCLPVRSIRSCSTPVYIFSSCNKVLAIDKSTAPDNTTRFKN